MLQEKQDKQKIVVLGFQKTKNKNKTTETELTAGVLKKKIFKKDTKGETERFLIIQNKTKCTFSRGSSSSKPQTIQKQTNHSAAAS